MDRLPRTSDRCSRCPTCTAIQLGNKSRGRELLQRRSRSDDLNGSRLGFLRHGFVSFGLRALLEQVRALVILSLGAPNFASGEKCRTIEWSSGYLYHSAPCESWL